MFPNLPLFSVRNFCQISQEDNCPIMIPKTVLKSVLWRGSEISFAFWKMQLLYFSLRPTPRTCLDLPTSIINICVQSDIGLKNVLCLKSNVLWASSPPHSHDLLNIGSSITSWLRLYQAGQEAVTAHMWSRKSSQQLEPGFEQELFSLVLAFLVLNPRSIFASLTCIIPCWGDNCSPRIDVVTIWWKLKLLKQLVACIACKAIGETVISWFPCYRRSCVVIEPLFNMAAALCKCLFLFGPESKIHDHVPWSCCHPFWGENILHCETQVVTIRWKPKLPNLRSWTSWFLERQVQSQFWSLPCCVPRIYNDVCRFYSNAWSWRDSWM